MFDLTNSRDFYAILVEDFDDFMAEPHSARRAVHCAITAYHLHEWVWGDWFKHDYDVWKALGIRDKDSFRSWIDGKCVWFLAVEELANGTKHFIRDQGFETMRIGGYGQDWVPPYGKGYLLIDYGEGAGEQSLAACRVTLGGRSSVLA
jgi:hypothetical protein